MNTVKTGVLLLFLTSLLLLTGALLGGMERIILFFFLALVMNVFAYWNSDKLALKMARAHEVGPDQDPDLHRIVGEQAQLARLPMPRVYVIENDTPNAFATGRNPSHAAVAVTTGIRRLLSREELGAVLAHEVAHVGNKDTLIMTVVAAVAGAIAMVAWMAQLSVFFGGWGGGYGNRSGGGNALGLIGMLAVAFLMPIAAAIVRIAISRTREYQADATGARTSGTPLDLASALSKLEQGNRAQPMPVNQAISHLFLVNPLTRGGMASLFSTHPPIQERIRRLEGMDDRMRDQLTLGRL